MTDQKTEVTTSPEDQILKVEKEIRNIIDEIYTTESNFENDMEYLKRFIDEQKIAEKLHLHKKEKGELNRILGVFKAIKKSHLKHPFPSTSAEINNDYDLQSAKNKLIKSFNESSDYFQSLQNALDAYKDYNDFLSTQQNNTKFKEAFQKIPAINNNIFLDGYISKPFQRLTKYTLFLEQLYKNFIKLNNLKNNDDKENELLKARQSILDLNKKKNDAQKEKEIEQTKKEIQYDTKGMKAFVKKIINSDYFDENSFVINLYQFSGGTLKPFGTNGMIDDVRLLLSNDNTFSDFRNFLKQQNINDINFDNIDTKLMFNKYNEAQNGNKAAIWLGIVILSKNATDEDQLKAWTNLGQLSSNTGFHYYNDPSFMRNVVEVLKKISLRVNAEKESAQFNFTKQKTRNEELQGDIKKLTTEKETQKEEIGKLKKENTEQKTEIEKLQKENTELQATLQKLQQEKTEQQKEIGELKQENTSKDERLNNSILLPKPAAFQGSESEVLKEHQLRPILDQIEKEILGVKKWRLGFFGRVFGARNYFAPDGNKKKMATGAFEILKVLHKKENLEETKNKINDILKTRVEDLGTYKEHSSRKQETKGHYKRWYGLLNGDGEQNRTQIISAP